VCIFLYLLDIFKNLTLFISHFFEKSYDVIVFSDGTKKIDQQSNF